MTDIFEPEDCYCEETALQVEVRKLFVHADELDPVLEEPTGDVVVLDAMACAWIYDDESGKWLNDTPVGSSRTWHELLAEFADLPKIYRHDESEVLRIGVGADEEALTENMRRVLAFRRDEYIEDVLPLYSAKVRPLLREFALHLLDVDDGTNAAPLSLGERVYLDPMDDAPDTEQISGEAYNRGAADVVRQAIEGLQAKYSDAISAERQDAYRIAMQIVEALA